MEKTYVRACVCGGMRFFVTLREVVLGFRITDDVATNQCIDRSQQGANET